MHLSDLACAKRPSVLLSGDFESTSALFWVKWRNLLARATRFTPSAWMMLSLSCVLSVVNSIRAQVVTFSRAPRDRMIEVLGNFIDMVLNPISLILFDLLTLLFS